MYGPSARTREGNWDSRVNHASRGNDQLHVSCKSFFTPDVYARYPPTQQRLQQTRKSRHLDVLRTRDVRFQNELKEKTWNPRAHVLPSKNNTVSHDRQREYFDAPRVLNTDTSTCPKFAECNVAALLPVAQFLSPHLDASTTRADMHSARGYVDGGHLKLFDWNSKPDYLDNTGTNTGNPHRRPLQQQQQQQRAQTATQGVDYYSGEPGTVSYYVQQQEQYLGHNGGNGGNNETNRSQSRGRSRQGGDGGRPSSSGFLRANGVYSRYSSRSRTASASRAEARRREGWDSRFGV